MVTSASEYAGGRLTGATIRDARWTTTAAFTHFFVALQFSRMEERVDSDQPFYAESLERWNVEEGECQSTNSLYSTSQFTFLMLHTHIPRVF